MFEVEEDVALQSLTIKNLIEGDARGLCLTACMLRAPHLNQIGSTHVVVLAKGLGRLVCRAIFQRN